MNAAVSSSATAFLPSVSKATQRKSAVLHFLTYIHRLPQNVPVIDNSPFLSVETHFLTQTVVYSIKLLIRNVVVVEALNIVNSARSV